MSKLMTIKNIVQDMIDQGVTSVEQIHRIIADMPFEMLEKIEPLKSAVKSAKNSHGTAVGGVYEIIRQFNREVGKQAGEWISEIDSLSGHVD